MIDLGENIKKTQINGWGGYPLKLAKLINPKLQSNYTYALHKYSQLIPRGMGRSYGDSANASVVLQTNNCNHFINLNEKTGLLCVQSGILLRTILEVIIKKGWFLPVTPGSSFVSVGGAIASDVHGKNHHVSGTFCEHVKSIKIMLGSGEIVTSSPSTLPDLFRATCGGMGLTGIILSAEIQLIPISSSYIYQKTFKANNLESVFEAFEDHRDHNYSVAWIDCLAKGKGLGRSILMVGDHAKTGGLNFVLNDPQNVPIYMPDFFLNSFTMGLFNKIYWTKFSRNEDFLVNLMPYFYPLDAIGNWNKIYGKKGFLQYQFVIPSDNGIKNMKKILEKIVKTGQASFLAVIKKFGPRNKNLLTFPIEGYTLSMDFKISSEIISVLNNLDDMIVDMGGRIYLTKDAIMKEKVFKSTYPNWEVFETIREKYGALGKFSSDQSKRLGLL